MSKNRSTYHISQTPAWGDLEAFVHIANGLRVGKNLRQIAEDPRSGVGGPRMLFLRLRRLEEVLGRRLVDRRPWGRDAHLTAAGEELAHGIDEVFAARQKLQEAIAGPVAAPVFRLVSRATLISTLLPAALDAERHHQQSGSQLTLELVTVSTYAEALAAVNDGRADVGLYLAFPDIDRVRVPRNVRVETLGRTEVVVLCHPEHRFATEARSGRRDSVRLEELADESVISRGYVDARLVPVGGSGRRIIAPHSLDKLSYVRLGIGVTLFPRLAYEIASARPDIVALPVRPRVTAHLCLLYPRKRLRSIGDHGDAFVEHLRAFSVRAVRRVLTKKPSE